jgi:hypothetical protein
MVAHPPSFAVNPVHAHTGACAHVQPAPYQLLQTLNLKPSTLIGPQAEEKARAQRGAERAAAVKAFRSEMSDRSSAAQEARRAAVSTSNSMATLQS